MDKGTFVPRQFPICISLVSPISDFDKSNEVLFRLGIIYKQQTKYDDSLRCFDRILRNPPSPLANADIWFQIGHVYEQQGDVGVSLLNIQHI
jgi:tetratricopeptide (TPR) repeat protein